MKSTPSLLATPARPKGIIWQYAALMVFVFLFSILLFTFLHESGHAVMGLLFGAKITSFSVDFIGMSAHVGLDSSFSPLQQALVSVGGFFLPLLLTLLFLISVPRRGNALLEWVKMLTALITISSLLAWVALPWIYLMGGRPGDDSITFLMNTRIYPPIVSLAAASVFAFGLAVFLDRTEGVKGIFKRMQAQPSDLLTSATRGTLLAMIAVFALVAGMSLGLGAVFGTEKMNFLAAPPDYSLATTIQLTDHPLAGETVASFTLDRPSSVSLFFAMKGLTHGPGKIALAGPGGYENIFFTADEKAAGNFTVNPRNLRLVPGQYQVVLTFPQDPGILKFYQKIIPGQSSTTTGP